MTALHLRATGLQARDLLRRVTRRIWPAAPTTWPDTRRLLSRTATHVLRLAVAAVLAYLGSRLLSPHVIDLTAPLTALLVVQASTVGTLRMGVVRVAAVLTGILVAIAVSAYVGLSWWSLGAVIIASLLLAKALRLGAQSLETPISAMLILGVASHEIAAETRLANTLIGAAVGIAISLLVPVRIPNARAHGAVGHVARSQAALLGRMSSVLRARPPSPVETDAWLDAVDAIGSDLSVAAAAVDAVEENRKLNVRALGALRIHTELRVALQRLERCRAAARALIVMLGQEAATPESADERTADLRGAFATVLDSLAAGVETFGDLVTSHRVESAEPAWQRLVDLVAETRAVLTELVLTNTDARSTTATWMLQGSMLASVDQILRQLDLEHPQQATAAWRPRPSLERLPRTWIRTGQRLGEPVLRQLAPALRGPRDR